MHLGQDIVGPIAVVLKAGLPRGLDARDELLLCFGRSHDSDSFCFSCATILAFSATATGSPAATWAMASRSRSSWRACFKASRFLGVSNNGTRSGRSNCERI